MAETNIFLNSSQYIQRFIQYGKKLAHVPFTHMKVKIIDGNKKLNVQIKSTNHSKCL